MSTYTSLNFSRVLFLKPNTYRHLILWFHDGLINREVQIRRSHNVFLHHWNKLKMLLCIILFNLLYSMQHVYIRNKINVKFFFFYYDRLSYDDVKELNMVEYLFLGDLKKREKKSTFGKNIYPCKFHGRPILFFVHTPHLWIYLTF